MMQSQLHPSWPFYNIVNSNLDQDVHHSLNNSEFSPSFTTTEDDYSSGISSIPKFSIDFFNFPASEMDFLLDLEEFEAMSDLYTCLEDSEGSFPSQNLSTEVESCGRGSPSPSMNSGKVLNLPGEDTEIDNKLSILHLLKAYGESMEDGHGELSDAILRCVSEKVNPVGETLERLAFSLSRDMERQGNYLKDESCNNFEAAFKAFYQIFPYGRFAHFAANSAVLEAMPRNVEMIHIVDFDMGEGIQWPPMIEAIAQQHKELRLTSIKMGEDCEYVPSQQSFEEAKRQLCSHARSFGLKLKMEEMRMEELVSETKRMKKRGGRREWLAFNCMVGLPHMGRRRCRRLVREFLAFAKDLIGNSGNRGVITFGNGDACEKVKNFPGFGSFFESHLVHYQALLASMESNFPIHLTEARLAMESLFVAPYISYKTWFREWEEMRECCCFETDGFGLEGWRVGKESLMEAKELVKEGESLYGVRIGKNENEIVLEWRGTPLVRVTIWRNQS